MKTAARRALLGCTLAALAAPVCWAGPREEVNESIAKFAAARSYHADMEIAGATPVTGQLDFVAPDRYRMSMSGMGEQTIIGDTMHLNIQGQTMQVPLPKGTLSQWRDPARLAENASSMTVTALGSEALDGEAAKKYRVEHTQPRPSTMTLWIGADGYPRQILATGQGQAGETVTTTIRYSRFNDPDIRIEAPN